MKEESDHIDKIFREKFADAASPEASESWTSVKEKLTRKGFSAADILPENKTKGSVTLKLLLMVVMVATTTFLVKDSFKLKVFFQEGNLPIAQNRNVAVYSTLPYAENLTKNDVVSPKGGSDFSDVKNKNLQGLGNAKGHSNGAIVSENNFSGKPHSGNAANALLPGVIGTPVAVPSQPERRGSGIAGNSGVLHSEQTHERIKEKTTLNALAEPGVGKLPKESASTGSHSFLNKNVGELSANDAIVVEKAQAGKQVENNFQQAASNVEIGIPGNVKGLRSDMPDDPMVQEPQGKQEMDSQARNYSKRSSRKNAEDTLGFQPGSSMENGTLGSKGILKKNVFAEASDFNVTSVQGSISTTGDFDSLRTFKKDNGFVDAEHESKDSIAAKSGNKDTLLSSSKGNLKKPFDKRMGISVGFFALPGLSRIRNYESSIGQPPAGRLNDGNFHSVLDGGLSINLHLGKRFFLGTGLMTSSFTQKLLVSETKTARDTLSATVYNPTMSPYKVTLNDSSVYNPLTAPAMITNLPAWMLPTEYRFKDSLYQTSSYKVTKYQYIGIPLMAGVNFGSGKCQLALYSGIVMNLPVSKTSTMKINYDTTGIYPASHAYLQSSTAQAATFTTFSTAQNTPYAIRAISSIKELANINWMYIGGVNIQYKLGKSCSFTAGPVVRYALKSVFNSQESVKSLPYSWSLQLGLIYRIR